MGRKIISPFRLLCCCDSLLSQPERTWWIHHTPQPDGIYTNRCTMTHMHPIVLSLRILKQHVVLNCTYNKHLFNCLRFMLIYSILENFPRFLGCQTNIQRPLSQFLPLQRSTLFWWYNLHVSMDRLSMINANTHHHV